MASVRVASLIASSTEIVCALGFADLLVARSHECDYPESVLDLPAITAAKLRTDVPSIEIDRQVRDILRAGLSVYRVDADRLRELDPQVILTQDHCEVCAVSTKDLEAAVCDWLGPQVTMVSLRPNTLRNVFDDIRRVADALGAQPRGLKLIDSLQRRMKAIQGRLPEVSESPRVSFIEWIEPLMAGGNWVPELIELLGAKDVLGRAGEHSGWITFDDVFRADPDVIVIAPCGFDVARTTTELPPLVEQPGWRNMRAVQSGRVYVADGNAYFNRPGPRLVESFEILAEILYPQHFNFNHAGIGYEKLR